MYFILFLFRDTAGQERFHTFTKQFFRGAQVCILFRNLQKNLCYHKIVLLKHLYIHLNVHY